LAAQRQGAFRVVHHQDGLAGLVTIYGHALRPLWETILTTRQRGLP
jgi:hypothetical protein